MEHHLAVFDWRRAGSWCGLAGPVVFLIMWLAAIASTPGYRVFEQWVSDLGVGGGAAYFNVGVIVAGILTIPFAVTLGIVLRPYRPGIIGSAFLVVAAFFLISIGIFTENAGEIHWLVSVSFFLSMLIALGCLVLPLYLSSAFAKWLGMFTAAIVILEAVMIAAFSAGPLTETTAVLVIAFWSIVVAWRMRVYLCVTLRTPAIQPGN